MHLSAIQTPAQMLDRRLVHTRAALGGALGIVEEYIARHWYNDITTLQGAANSVISARNVPV